MQNAKCKIGLISVRSADPPHWPLRTAAGFNRLSQRSWSLSLSKATQHGDQTASASRSIPAAKVLGSVRAESMRWVPGGWP